ESENRANVNPQRFRRAGNRSSCGKTIRSNKLENVECPHGASRRSSQEPCRTASDTSSSVIFECRPDGYAEGDLLEWIGIGASFDRLEISVQTYLPAAVKEPQGTSLNDAHTVDDASIDSQWNLAPKTLGPEVQRACPFLPTAVERANDDADHVCGVIQASVNEMVIERGRIKSETGRMIGFSFLFLLFALATYLLGGHPGWIAPTLIALLTGASAAECAARRRGLDVAISSCEEGLRQHGVSVNWERRGDQVRAVMKWKALNLRLNHAAVVNGDPDFTRQK
ncbi:hypothetical protein, partial [Sphingomonas sp. TZW2008]|uniref:hypothetical protein n=1 Tax=Sphingomonas sp. TZW2008 TaxID=1917973 RepID=UPI0015C50531